MKCKLMLIVLICVISAAFSACKKDEKPQNAFEFTAENMPRIGRFDRDNTAYSGGAFSPAR